MSRAMVIAELVVVGDELLAGRTQDTNSRFLCRELASLGLSPLRITTVPDSEEAITGALEAASARAGLVFVVGGLGPTPDDRTMAAVAGLFGLRLIEDSKTKEGIRERHRRMGSMMPSLALRQALVPEGARLFANPVGMVPGVALSIAGRRCTVILLPGVPQEMEAIFQEGIVSFLVHEFARRPEPSVRIRTLGVPEAVIAALIGRRGIAEETSAAYYPSTFGVDVVIRGTSRKRLRETQARVVELLGERVYEVGERDMAEVVGDLLRRRRWTVATAESCTGGFIGDRLTNVPGSSDYYAGGVIAYDNEAKVHLLGVSPGTLKRFGAVSAAVVRQMAEGVRVQLNSDVGLSVSGIAGPGGATRTKPVGLVYVGVSLETEDRACCERLRFFGTRRMVKERAAQAALDLVRRALER